MPVIGDRVGEWNELFFLNLSNPTYANIANPRALGTIIDDEPYVSLEYYSDPATVEGNSGTTPMTFTVDSVRRFGHSRDCGFFHGEWQRRGRQRLPGRHRNGDFRAGQTTQTITVQVIGDTQAEDRRVLLRQPVAMPPMPRSAHAISIGYISDDDRIAAISISDASVYEGNNGTKLMTFTVSLSQPSTKKVRVNYATANGTAKTSDNDYVAKSGTITFNPGQTTKTITISIKGDKKKESDESFFVNLSGASGAPIEDGQGEGWIFNDDAGSSQQQEVVCRGCRCGTSGADESEVQEARLVAVAVHEVFRGVESPSQLGGGVVVTTPQ